MTYISCIIGFFKIFLYCLFGRLATDQFDELSNYLFDSDWPNLPVKLQKYYILMLANVQQPHYFDGFGVLVLDLETFRKVREPWRLFRYVWTPKQKSSDRIPTIETISDDA